MVVQKKKVKIDQDDIKVRSNEWTGNSKENDGKNEVT